VISLSHFSIILGAIIVASRLPCLLAPEKFRPFVLAFPRSVVWGRILAAIATIWSAIFVYNAATGEWAQWRPWVVILAPVVYLAVIFYADQFLSVRAAAALILFVAKIGVDAADRSELQARFFVTILMYVWVVMAIVFAISPHLARDLTRFATANDTRWRIFCAISVLIGLVLIALGAFVY
jgi:hypothetical protein